MNKLPIVVLSLCLLFCAVYASQLQEVAPHGAWGEQDRREFACEAAILMVHDMPLGDVVKVADLLLRLNQVQPGSMEARALSALKVSPVNLDPTVVAILETVKTGMGPKPVATFPSGAIQTVVPISGRATLERGQ